MNDSMAVVLLVAGVWYAGHVVKNVNNVQVQGKVECQRLKSDASISAAAAGITLPQCEESVTNFAGIKL
jgi:hypothetical protein